MADQVKEWSARQEAINEALINGLYQADIPAADPEDQKYAEAAQSSIQLDNVKDVCKNSEELSAQISGEIENQLNKVAEEMAGMESPYSNEFYLMDQFKNCNPENFSGVWAPVKGHLKSAYPAQFDLDFFDSKFKATIDELKNASAKKLDLQGTPKDPVDGADGESAEPKEGAYKADESGAENGNQSNEENPPEKKQENQELIRNRFEAIKEMILAKWQEQLLKKQLQWEKEQIKQKMKDFNQKLDDKARKVKDLKRNLQKCGMADELGMDSGYFWDLGDGNFQNVNFNVLEEYSRLLERDPSIKKLAEMLGRMHQSEKECDEEIYVSIESQTEWKFRTAIKSELVGVRESDDLSSLLPTEVTFLSDPELELVFYKKLAEKKLATYDYHAKMPEKYEEAIEVEVSNTRQKAKESEKGPFIICVDTSGSMGGTPEMVAKTLCFAILKIAMRDNRKAYLISFSTRIETIELTDIRNSLKKVIAFLQMSFHGGTDATPALNKALDMLNHADYKLSDVIMVSDFCMGNLGSSLNSKIQNAKKNKTKFHSLEIGYGSNGGVVDLFDSNWFYDERDPNGSIKRVTKNIKDRWC